MRFFRSFDFLLLPAACACDGAMEESEKDSGGGFNENFMYTHEHESSMREKVEL